MKTISSLLFLLVAISACDAPVRSRPATVLQNGSQSPISSGNSTNFGSTGGGDSWTGGTTGTSNGSTRPPGFESCDPTPRYYAAGIGTIGVCQSSSDETSIMVKSTVADVSEATCLIPMYKDGSGNSTYLSTEPQCFRQEAGKEVYGKLYKTRNGYTNQPLNGLMVMKQSALVAFYNCMNAISRYSDPSCPYGAQTPTYQQRVPPYQIVNCLQRAQSFMSQQCNDFKVMYSYLDIRLK